MAGAVEVTLIRAGLSGNGNLYPAETLRASVGLWEGATAFVDHPTALDGTRAGGRSVRDIAGVYRGARWQEGAGVRATLHFAPGAEWLERLVRGAIADRAAGRSAPRIGVSADMVVRRRPIALEGAPGSEVWEVTRIERVNSVDVVWDPAAGGSFDAVVEAERRGGEPLAAQLPLALGRDWGDGNLVRQVEVLAMDDAMVIGAREAATGAGAGAQVAGADGPSPALTGTADASAGAARVCEALPGTAGGAGEAVARLGAGLPLPGGPGGAQPASGGHASGTGGGTTRAAGSELELRQALCRGLLEARLARAELPEVAAAAVRRRLGGRVFEATELDTEIEEVRGLLASGAVGGTVRGHGAARSTVSGLVTAGERLQAALDRLFGVPVPEALMDVPRLSGIREAYTSAAALRSADGDGWGELGLAREANETTTTALTNLLRNSMTKRLVQDYRAQPRWWEPVVTIAAISDMKVQDRIRLNDFGALATVSENAAYANVQWGDARETYTPVKKGNTVAVTLEAILNDDTHAITRIPQKLASAAAVTINEFVANLFTSNPTMSDTFPVYDATNHGGNQGTAALDATSLQAAIATVMKQTNSAGKRIGIRPRFLLVPVDLLWTALTLVQSALKPGTPNNDVNVLRGALEVIPVPQFTDATDWYLQTDPRELEGIELGFLGGRQEPELLVQDAPTAGAAFTNDAITFKVRWIFGGGWVDYRGAYRAVVAG